MEFEKICDTDNQGLYTLVFPNKHGLQMEEIEAFFSQFDGFNDVRAAGTERGYRFPRFKTLEGAKSAFEALADHPTISLIPYVNRKKNDKNQENRSNKENIGSNNRSNFSKGGSLEIAWGTDKPEILKENSLNQEEPAKVVNGSGSENRRSSVSMRLMKYKRDPALTGDEETKSEINLQNKNSETNLTHEEAKSAVVNLTRVENTPLQSNKFNGVCDNNSIHENNVDVNSVVYSKSEVNRVSDVTSPSKFNGFSGGSISQKSESISDFETPGLLIRAGEVVVGNMHPAFGPAFMLHLFDEYEPLAVSNVQHVKNSRSRYCHVYFRTSADAIEVEKQFDGHDLMGQKLLVLQPKTLVNFKAC